MNGLAQINDFDTHMESVFGGGGNSNVIFYPYLKFKEKTVTTKIKNAKGKEEDQDTLERVVTITTKNEEKENIEKEFKELKVRMIYKTNIYQLSSGNGGDFKILGQSSEFLDRQSFIWFDLEKKSFKKGLRTSQEVKDLCGGAKVDFKTVIYFHVEGFGIVKAYLKRTQTCGMVKDKSGKVMYQFDTPMAGGFDDFTRANQGKKLYDYLVEIKAKSYKLGEFVIVYPVFGELEESLNPDVITWVQEIFQNILNDTQYRLSQCESEMGVFDDNGPRVVDAENDTSWMSKKIVEQDNDLPF